MPPDRILSFSKWLTARWWIIVIVGAFSLALWNHSLRIGRVNHVSNLAGGEELVVDAESPTGYEKGFRKLIVPERNADSLQWIMQVQKMYEEDIWRLHHVDYDNAPEGRSVRTTSLYRWWLGGVAWLDHVVSGNPIGLSVERAALFADPLVQLLFLAITAIFLIRYFNGWSAASFTIGFVVIFPLGGAFAPGQPSELSLLLVCTVWSVLPLAAAFSAKMREDDVSSRKKRRRLFVVAGVFGGLGMWVGVKGQLPVLLGIGLAGLVIGYFQRRNVQDNSNVEMASTPWRAWAFGGASVVLLAWLIDRSPEFLNAGSWRPDFVHPLYSVAWLGLAEILVIWSSGFQGKRRRGFVALFVSFTAIGGLLYTMYANTGINALSIDPLDTRLTQLPIDTGVSSLGAFLSQKNATLLIFATLVPAALLIAGIAALSQIRRSLFDASMLAFICGPALLSLGFSVTKLGWWAPLDGLILVLAAALLSLPSLTQGLKWSVVGIVGGASMMGMALVMPRVDREKREAVDPAELVLLIERHLAQWLSIRALSSESVALAPPHTTVSLAFYGGIKGIGSPYPENNDGFSSAVRLCAAASADEARAVAAGREVGFIVHPSWDTFLEEYARLGMDQPENSFIAMLNRWLPPRWLQPVSFRLPSVAGFEKEWVVIFRTVEVQDNASAIARLVEYFLDMGRGEQAIQAQKALANNFSSDIVTHLTGAEIAAALRDSAAFRKATDSILESIESGADNFLPWDLRVSMTLVLAGAKKADATKNQLKRCLDEADKDSLSRLSPSSLRGLLQLSKAFGLEFSNPDLKPYAVSLLPTEQRVGL